jgi:uncharacterized protein (DUF2147 family)
MRKFFVFVLAVCLLFALVACSDHADQSREQSIVGVWSVPVLQGKDSGKERYQVEIFDKDGVFYGKIVKLSNRPSDALCAECKGDKKGKPLMGMIVLWNLKKEAGRYVDGKILDADLGKEYDCSLVLVKPELLKVTASLLFIKESHYWTRVK